MFRFCALSHPPNRIVGFPYVWPKKSLSGYIKHVGELEIVDMKFGITLTYKRINGDCANQYWESYSVKLSTTFC